METKIKSCYQSVVQLLSCFMLKKPQNTTYLNRNIKLSSFFLLCVLFDNDLLGLKWIKSKIPHASLI